MEPGESVVQWREAGRKRRVGGSSGERQTEKAWIESEWAEWPTGLSEQQVHAKIDPRPDKEEYDDYGWLRDPSFIGPVVQGAVPPQSNASSPESGAPIGPWPPQGPAVMAGSGLIGHPPRHSGAAESSRSELRDMNRLALNSLAMLRRLAEGRAGLACLLGHPRHAAVGADQCACPVCTPCGPSDLGHTACLYLVAAALRQRCEKNPAVHHERYWWPWW